tara:strand:- start:1 stop:387 length:387 start_codon:yes stop_codon:yes gene_type:complete
MKWTKNHRLRKRWQFQKVQQRGSKKRVSCFLVLYLPSSENKTRNESIANQSQTIIQSRIGITVSKKVGNAVVRNQVKRWLREAARREYSLLNKAWDIVIIASNRSKKAGFVTLQQELRTVFLFLSKKS